METIYRICLTIAGIINTIPFLIAFMPNKILGSYGITVSDANLELVLRHRAVLFGIVGGLMIFSAISKKHYDLAFIMGMVSMVSFIILFYSISGEINPELTKVMKIDLVAIAVLVIGYGLYKFN